MTEEPNGWLKEAVTQIHTRLGGVEKKLDEAISESARTARHVAAHAERIDSLTWWKNLTVTAIVGLISTGVVGAVTFIFGAALLAVKYLGK